MYGRSPYSTFSPYVCTQQKCIGKPFSENKVGVWKLKDASHFIPKMFSMGTK